MDVDAFWSLVDDTHAKASGRGRGSVMERHIKALTKALKRLPEDEVQAFDRHLRTVRTAANNWGLWAAAYLALGGASDDSFLDFRTWLVSHGRSTYERVLTDPDALADLSWDEDEEDFGLAEEWGYVPVKVLEDRGLDPDEHDAANDDIDDFGKPTGEPFLEDDNAWFAGHLPRLWAKYGNRSIE